MIHSQFGAKFYEQLDAFFQLRGFGFFPDQKQDRKSTQNGFQNIIFSISEAQNVFWVEVNFGVRFEFIEQIAQQFLNNSFGYRPAANTLVISIGKFLEIKYFRYKVSNQEDFDKVINVNVKGLWNCMKVALQHFIAQRSGNIVNIASVAGHLGMVGHIAYSASKHAVIGMTKTAGIEYAKHGIRINAVCPGFTQTPMLEGADTDDTYLEALQHATPMKRLGKPEEIADALV